MRCSNPLPPSADQRFTIHSLWPQDAMDDPVDPNTSTHSYIPKPPIEATGLTGAEPEIACNVNSNNKEVQLWKYASVIISQTLKDSSI
ncbi:hypothetical protein V6N13_005256 [Hibiscus sabdariffa]